MALKKSKTNGKYFLDIEKPERIENHRDHISSEILKVTFIRNEEVQKRVELVRKIRDDRKEILRLTLEISGYDEMINKKILRLRTLK